MRGSRPGPTVAENFAEVGQNGFPLLAVVNFCLENVIVLPVFEAWPFTLPALTEQVIGFPANCTVTVTEIGLVLLWPLTVTGKPLASLTDAF